MSNTPVTRVAAATLMVVVLVATAPTASAQTRETLAIRGQGQVLRVYGPPAGTPVVVASGDGGWIHLGPHVAETLAAKGFFVVGFDVRAYLEAFTAKDTTLRVEDVRRDFKTLVDFAARGSTERPLLIGVSEGAGLSVLVASDPVIKGAIAGVIGLGLSDRNELAWRWKDALIYLTHTTPNEPTFSAAAIIDRVSPLPLALIHSIRDEYVPVTEAKSVFARAHAPRRLWIVTASDHRFSDNLPEFDRSLCDAIAWVKSQRAK